MLTNTSATAIQLLLYLNRCGEESVLQPAEVAERLNASPTYLSKIVSLLAKADLVHTYRGAKGGVRLAHPATSITLRQVVEACQGRILGDYCREWDNLDEVCAFHGAMFDLQQSIIAALERYTLDDLARKPLPIAAAQPGCRMRCVFGKDGD